MGYLGGSSVNVKGVRGLGGRCDGRGCLTSRPTGAEESARRQRSTKAHRAEVRSARRPAKGAWARF